MRAKKTQRDKDWPMIRRLVEQSYFEHSGRPTDDLVRFWLRELRTPELLVDVSNAHREAARTAAASRRAVQYAILRRVDDLAVAGRL